MYENLREKYYITADDIENMWELRRKWAFDDLLNEFVSEDDWADACDGNIPTEEQIEDIISEYVELRVFDRSDWELEQESNDLYEAIDRVMNRNGR